jgi:hypothetical protein
MFIDGVAPPAPRSFAPLITALVVGGSAGLLLTLGFGLLTAGTPDHGRGLVLGALAGVVLVPFVVLAFCVSLFLGPWTAQGLLAEYFLSPVADQASERNYRPAMAILLAIVLGCMSIGGFLGYRSQVADLSVVAHQVTGTSRGRPAPDPTNDLALLLPAALGGLMLGAGLGAMCALRPSPLPTHASSEG